MKITRTMEAMLLLTLTAAFVWVAPVSAVQHNQDDKHTSGAMVKKEAVEAYDALRAYTADQRDEAIETARSSLDELDARIEKVQNDLDARWKEMNEVARLECREKLRQLRKQRNQVSEWYGGLKHSSAEAWEEIKRGFSKSYTTLSESLEKAMKHFEEDK